jgi:hypothetical protein
MNAPPSQTNLGRIGQSAGSAEVIVSGRTMIKPVSAHLWQHARKHTWNISYALVWHRFDSRAPRNKHLIHGPTYGIHHKPSKGYICGTESATALGGVRLNTIGSAEPNFAPTQAQPPRAGSYQPQEAIPTVQHSSRWNKWFGRSTHVRPNQAHSEPTSAFSYKCPQAP